MSAIQVPVRRYAVFISYRHADNKDMGRKWANWLHESLETYEIPKDLAGTADLRGGTVPASLYPVFRDEEELPADADLSTNICRALDNSAQLVVLCSPRAVQSRFVADEIRYFKEIGKSHCILALMIDGEPNASGDPAKLAQMGTEMECFPEPLRFGVPDRETGRVDWTKRTEPIAADVRPASRPVQGWTSAGAYDEALGREGKLNKTERAAAVQDYAAQLELAKLKVVAGALGLPLGVLTQRDKAAQLAKARRRAAVMRRWLAAVGVLAILAIGGGVMAWKQYQEADRQFKEASRQLERSLLQEGKFWMEKSAAALQSRDPLTAIMLSGRAIGFHGCGRPEQPSADFASKWSRVIGAPFQSDAALETERAKLAEEALKNVTTASPSWLPLWSSPVPAEEGRVQMLATAFSADGTRLATAMEDHTVRVWNTLTGAEEMKLSGHTGEVICVAFSPDAKWLASGSEDNSIRLCGAGSGKEVRTITLHTNTVRRVLFTPDGTHLVSCSADNSIRLWDAATGREIRSFTGHTDEVLDIAISPNGKWLVSGSVDGTVRLWEVESGREMRQLPPHDGNVSGVAFDGSGREVISASMDGVIRYSNAVNGSEIRLLDNDCGAVTGIALHGPYGQLAVAHRGGVVQIFHISSEYPGLILMPHGSETTGLQFSPDGRRLATCGADGIVKLHDAGTRMLSRSCYGHTAPLWQAAFSADGRMVASASEDKTVRLWDVPSNQEIAVLTGGTAAHAAAFSPDGNSVVSGSADGSVTLWDVATAKLRITMAGHKTPVRSVIYSPDGRHIASASVDSVRVWDAPTGAARGSVELGDFGAGQLCFSPDSQRLALVFKRFQSGTDFTPDVNLEDLKAWRIEGLQPLTVPSAGQRAEFAAWLENADRIRSPDKSAAIVLAGNGFEIQQAWDPPARDLVALMGSGLLREEGDTWSGRGTGFPSPRRPLTSGRDLFSRLVAEPGDPILQIHLCMEFGRPAAAAALWQKSEATAPPAAQRDYLLIAAARLRKGSLPVSGLLPLLKQNLLKDAVVSAAVLTTLRSLPDAERSVLIEHLKAIAPAGWLSGM